MQPRLNSYLSGNSAKTFSESTLRLVATVGLAATCGGVMGLASAGSRAETAIEIAENRTLEVHQASRLFLDWLSDEAGDKRLDSLTLRRIALLEVARARRSQGLAGLSLILGSLLLFTAHIASTLRRGIERLPDRALDFDFEIAKTSPRRKSPHRLPTLRSATDTTGVGHVRRTSS